jgi:DNA repair protein RadC
VNAPASDSTPSQQDIEITHRLSKTGEIVGIKLVDHIIIAGSHYYSFAKEGMV